MHDRRLSSRRITQRGVPVIASIILATGYGAFDAPDAEYVGICVDPVTNVRLHDEQCGDFDDEGDNGGSGAFFLWLPLSYGGNVPAVGQSPPPDVGSRRVPSGTPLVKGAPTQGGSLPSIARGGLGVKAGVSGGTGGRAGGSGS